MQSRIAEGGHKPEQSAPKLSGAPKVGSERWRSEIIGYKAWCDLARKRGWKGEEDSDALREYCEPEDAAIYTVHRSRDEAVTAAVEWFKANPDDSAFGAIIIDHQFLEAAHDDGGNLIRGCKPTWETQLVLEVTSDGDVLESRP